MKSFKTGACKEHIYTQWGPRRAAMNSFWTLTCRKWKKVRLLTGIVKRNLPAAVRESGPGAVVDGPSLHDARLGGVRLGSPHQHIDPGGVRRVWSQRLIHTSRFLYSFIILLCLPCVLCSYRYDEASFIFIEMYFFFSYCIIWIQFSSTDTTIENFRQL